MTRSPLKFMASMWWLFVISMLCFSSGQVYGQCIFFEGSPATSHKCDSIIDYEFFYLPPGRTYAEADKLAGNVTKYFGAFVPESCRSVALELICYTNFPECQWTNDSLEVISPCRSLCYEMINLCAAAALEAGLLSLLPNCTLYPLDMCRTGYPNASIPYGQADCPYPLKFDPSEEGTGNTEDMCVLPCPNPMYTDGEWTAGTILLILIAGLSFFLDMFIVVTWTLSPELRRYPSVLILWIALASAGAVFAILLYLLVGGPTRTVCTWTSPSVAVTFDNAREQSGQGVVCILAGMLFLFFALAGNFWWFALTLCMFEILVLHLTKETTEKVYYVFHAICWGLPLIPVIIVLCAQQFGSQDPLPTCFIVGNQWWAWTLYYIPVGITLILGTILILISTARVLKTRLKDQRRRMQEHIIRLLLLVFLYWLILLYPWIFRIYTEVITNDLETALEEQVQCSLLTGEDCPLSERLNYGLWLLYIFDVTGHGCIIFLFFGTSRAPFYFWWSLIKSWRNPMAVMGNRKMSSLKFGNPIVSSPEGDSPHLDSVDPIDDL